MFQKKNLGNWIFFALVAANICLWLAFPPVDDGREHWSYQYAGEVFSTSGLIMMSCGILLSTRPRWLERLFGGLDKMYKTHRTLAITAILFIFAHFIIVSLGRGVSLGPSLGKIALIGFLLSFFLALAPRIPFIGGYIRLKYHQWRFTHKFIGLFFIIGLLHSFRVQNLMQTTLPVRIYVLTICAAGVLLYLYKELLHGFLQKRAPYVVESVRKLNGTVVEVAMTPKDKRLSHKAGQFLFVSFSGDKHLKEAHPFTISSAPDSHEVKLAIKTSGDFTQKLYDQLKPGDVATLQGGHGMFNYKTGGDKQIWIAGGIGLTPFLSWMRDFRGTSGKQIDFYYAMRSPDEAVYLDEIERASVQNESFRVHLHVSNKAGRLTGEKIAQELGDIKGREIYMCGPFPMTEALKEQFLKLGVGKDKIHYEEFNFR